MHELCRGEPPVAEFQKISAVNDLSSTSARRIFGLLGPNGAGKPHPGLCGIMLPSSGSVNVLGYDVTTTPTIKKATRVHLKFSLKPYVENILFYLHLMPRTG